MKLLSVIIYSVFRLSCIYGVKETSAYNLKREKRIYTILFTYATFNPRTNTDDKKQIKSSWGMVDEGGILKTFEKRYY